MAESGSKLLAIDTEVYFMLFGRVPDTEGMQYWIDQLNAGMHPGDLVDMFAASQEFHNKYDSVGNTTDGLNLLLSTGLDRHADSGDLRAWEPYLAQGGSLADLAKTYASTSEFEQLHSLEIQKISTYYGLLNRPPTEAELTQASDDPLTLITALYNSEEYTGEAVPAFTPLPVISVAEESVTVDEGAGIVTITVNRAGTLDIENTVSYEVPENGRGNDYISHSGLLNFAAGETSKQVQIEIIDDDEIELNESFNVQLVSAEGAKLSNSRTEIVINDNEGLQPVEIAEFAEGNVSVLNNIHINSASSGYLIPTAADDMNGDGLADFVISTYDAHYLIFGSPELSDSLPNLETLDGTTGVVIPQGEDRLVALESAGDINGDGFDDLIFGNPSVDNDTGQAYLLFGHAGQWTPSLSLTEDLNGNNGVLIEGISPTDGTGYAVSGVGDVNGDGYDDLAIGSPWAIDAWETSYYMGFPAGQVHLIYGHEGQWDAQFKLSEFDASEGTAIVGNDQFGDSIIGLGDINSDGIDDFAVMEGGNATRFNSFRGDINIHLIYGNTNGWDAPYFLDDRAEGDTVKIENSGYVGSQSISATGDFNGDALTDIVIGATSSSYYGALVVFGTESGLPSTIPLTELLETNGSEVDEIPGWSRNKSVPKNLGDINNDGIDDLKVADYILYGHTGDWDLNVTLRSLSEQEATRFAFTGYHDAAGLGDVNGDGIDDFMVTDTRTTDSNKEEVAETSKAYLIFGSDQLFG